MVEVRGRKIGEVAGQLLNGVIIELDLVAHHAPTGRVPLHRIEKRRIAERLEEGTVCDAVQSYRGPTSLQQRSRRRSPKPTRSADGVRRDQPSHIHQGRRPTVAFAPVTSVGTVPWIPVGADQDWGLGDEVCVISSLSRYLNVGRLGQANRKAVRIARDSRTIAKDLLQSARC